MLQDIENKKGIIMLNLELWIFYISLSSAMCIFIKNAVFRVSILVMVIFCVSVLLGTYSNIAYAITFLSVCFYLLVKNYNKLIDC